MNLADRIQMVEWQIDVSQTFSQVLRRTSRFIEAQNLCRKNIEMSQCLSDDIKYYMIASVEYEMGKIARDQGNWPLAERYFLSARSVYNEDASGQVFNFQWVWGLLGNLGLVAHKQGHLDMAAEYYLRTLQFFREHESTGDLATTLVRLADLELERANKTTAQRYAQEALELCRRLNLAQELQQLDTIMSRLAD